MPYSKSMGDLFKNGYTPKLRPSGHNISDKFGTDNGGSIPPNLLAIPNTESNDIYTNYCKENNLTVHPARYASELPEFFVRMLTNENDLVFDPFGGSCVTGAVCEILHREWICSELLEEYLKGAIARFTIHKPRGTRSSVYALHNPSASWTDIPTDLISENGGKNRPPKK